MVFAKDTGCCEKTNEMSAFCVESLNHPLFSYNDLRESAKTPGGETT
jgi:hypothetical protein